MTGADIARRCAWVGFPIAGMLWVATRYSHNWYHADEWSIIGLTTGSKGWLSGASASYQGHLQVGTYLVYRLQRIWWGLEGHELVYLAFCTSLAALQLTVATVLRRLGLPTLIALLAATVVTFFGPGAQNMVYEFQLTANFALALCFAACFVALRDHRTPKAAVAIAGLLVAAIGTDSGIATFGVAFVAVVIVLLWPRRLIALALGPPTVVYLAWFAFGDNGKYLAASVGTMMSFAYHLFFLSAGGLVGGGETQGAILRGLGAAHPASSPTIPLSGETVGIIALVLASVCVAFGFVRHRLPRKVVATFIGGLVAAVLAVVVITKTRAYLIDPASEIPGSRYLLYVAVVLLLAFAPAIAATLRPAAPRSGRGLGIAAAAVLVAIFVANLHQVGPVRRFEEAWGMDTESRVRQSVTVLTEGCGEGSKPDPRANVVGQPTGIPTEITVGLVQNLLASGDLTSGFGIPATPRVREAVCRLRPGAGP